MPVHQNESRSGSRLSTMERKVPRNPRYEHVEGRVNSGMTVHKVSNITARQYLRRRDEDFARLSPPQLYELFAEYERDSFEGMEDHRGNTDPDNHGPKIVVHDQEDRPEYDRPYLILDMRRPEDFSLCHITQARCFPASNLKQDRQTQELVRFRNQEGKLIVLYESEERLAVEAANTLIARGFTNIFVLSGGLGAFSKAYPDFVEGEPPQPPPTSRTGRGAVSQRSTAGSTRGGGDGSSSMRSMRHEMNLASSRAGSGPGAADQYGVGRRSSNGSVGGGDGSRRLDLSNHVTAGRRGGGGGGGVSQRSDRTVADSVISRATSRKGRF